MGRLRKAEETLRGKSVLVTGHSGFTGGWAATWLNQIGADVSGYSLAPNTVPSLFESASIASRAPGTFADILDYEKLLAAMQATRPDLVLHLAAQPLVRRSYADPLGTFSVNVMGTANVLEAARHSPSVKGVVCVTTDKVYRNNEWSWPYRESDVLGGKDPYSASKAAAEFVIDSFAKSFPNSEGKGPAIATARGGNIIGGGDWSEDRIVPDFVKAVRQDQELTLRFPMATRPWQHVLALVHAYILLLAGLIESPNSTARAWNFGPLDIEQFPVGKVVELLSEAWARPKLNYLDNSLPEAGALALDSSNAFNLLGWRPAWDTQEAIKKTADWFRAYYAAPESARELTLRQISEWRASVAD